MFELQMNKMDRLNNLYNKFKYNVGSWCPMTQINEYIYLGGISEPLPDNEVDKLPLISRIYHRPTEYVKNNNISYIISILEDKYDWKLPEGIYHYQLILMDAPNQNINYLFNLGINVIKQAQIEKKKVLIHCRAGMSRSVTLLASYFLRYGLNDNLSPTTEEVLDFIKMKRGCICPNYGFLAQLLEYENLLKELYSN